MLPDGSKLTIQTMVNTQVIAVKVNDIALVSITNMGCLDYTSHTCYTRQGHCSISNGFYNRKCGFNVAMHNNGSYRLWCPQAVKIKPVQRCNAESNLYHAAAQRVYGCFYPGGMLGNWCQLCSVFYAEITKHSHRTETDVLAMPCMACELVNMTHPSVTEPAKSGPGQQYKSVCYLCC